LMVCHGGPGWENCLGAARQVLASAINASGTAQAKLPMNLRGPLYAEGKCSHEKQKKSHPTESETTGCGGGRERHKVRGGAMGKGKSNVFTSHPEWAQQCSRPETTASPAPWDRERALERRRLSEVFVPVGTLETHRRGPGARS